MTWEEVTLDLNIFYLLQGLKINASFLQDPEVQLGGIFSPYTIEVVDQQHFPSCFIDNSP